MLSELEIFRQAARYGNENETEKVIMKISKSDLRKCLVTTTTSHNPTHPHIQVSCGGPRPKSDLWLG